MADVPEGMDLWVLAGQSNMEGVALMREAMAPPPRVWQLHMAGDWRPAADPLHYYPDSYTLAHGRIVFRQEPELTIEQIRERFLSQTDWPRREQGAGLGVSFGRAMSELSGRDVGLIPCAHGGTGLDLWDPARKSEGHASLYGAMLDRIERARERGNLCGLLWYQGESDANFDLGATYLERFQRWVAALREDTGEEDLPVIVVQIGRVIRPPLAPRWTGWDVVREALRKVPETIPNTAVTTALDLPLTDAIHISSAGLVRLGQRLARLAHAFETTPGDVTGPRVRQMTQEPAHRGMTRLRLACDGVTGGWRGDLEFTGFSIVTEAGDPHPECAVIHAAVDPEQTDDILILLTTPVPEDGRLAYGLGESTYGNVTDTADMPLCALPPTPVAGQK